MAVAEDDGATSILTLFNCKLKREWESFCMFRVRCLNIFGLVLLLFITACSDSKIESNGMRTPEQVPEFDKVVFSDEVGKVHGPVQTQFGYHLIYISKRD